jgi:multidrug transporter EmrE-like cation transporter
MTGGCHAARWHLAGRKPGVAFAISGSFFYILVAMPGWLSSGERLATIQRIGIVPLSIGVLLISQFGKP